jgi:ABC-2 type transport system ATP-binding protein
LIVIGRGRLIADTTVEEFIARAAPEYVIVATPDGDRLAALLAGPAVRISGAGPGLLAVHGRSAAQIGEVAWVNRIRIHELRATRISLEEAFLEITGASVEYRATVDHRTVPVGAGQS